MDNSVQEFAVMILGILATAFGGVVPFTQWLKNKLGFGGWKALLLSAVVSAVAAIIVSWSNGDLLPGSVSWGNVWETFLVVLGLAQAFYWATTKED